MSAIIHEPRATHHRHRSSSDPFSDPYAPRQTKHRPPVPPPKAMAAVKPRDNMLDAVRDTVTINHSPRKVVRSQTQLSPTVGPPSASRAPQAPRRSHSQDSATPAIATVDRGKTKSSRPKKGSQHADVIDRLDFTGVGPMFHHDGPFDACAPSRNRHRTKAPMLAWSSSAADPNAASASNDSPYPAPDTYKNTFSNNYYDPPKKKVDVIAEAWGIHEPEPFEDFSAGGGYARPDGDTPTSSIYNGRDNTRAKRTKDGRDAREGPAHREYLDEAPAPRRTQKRTALPPPQPIFVPDADHPDLDGPLSSPPPGSATFAPRRNKSIMQRIRNMRESPNVPVAAYESTEPVPPSPNSAEGYGGSSYPPATRPSHRTNNSFLGRFGGNGKEETSPTQETYERSKDLPATPHGYGQSGATPYTDQESAGYFDELGYNSSPNGQALGRKTTILKKVKGVVRGSK